MQKFEVKMAQHKTLIATLKLNNVRISDELFNAWIKDITFGELSAEESASKNYSYNFPNSQTVEVFRLDTVPIIVKI